MSQVVGAGSLLALTVVSAVLLVRRPRHTVTAVLSVMTAASLLLLLAVVPERWVNPLWGLSVLPLSALLVVFPDGPRGPGWRWVFTYLVVSIGVVTVLSLAFPADEATPLVVLTNVLAASVIPIAGAAVVSLVRLRRQSTGDRRSRIGASDRPRCSGERTRTASHGSP